MYRLAVAMAPRSSGWCSRPGPIGRSLPMLPPAPALFYHRLAPRLGELLRQQARDHVRGAARGEGTTIFTGLDGNGCAAAIAGARLRSPRPRRGSRIAPL